VGLLPDYSRQAERYDETRAASPSVWRVLLAALEGAPGRRLADLGGGTGNYALALSAQGWEPVVVDRSAVVRWWVSWRPSLNQATTRPAPEHGGEGLPSRG
jgi:hypothetical protein